MDGVYLVYCRSHDGLPRDPLLSKNQDFSVNLSKKQFIEACEASHTQGVIMREKIVPPDMLCFALTSKAMQRIGESNKRLDDLASVR